MVIEGRFMKEIIQEKERFLKTKEKIGIVLDETMEKLKNQNKRHQESNQEMLNISKDYSSDDVRAELSQSLQVFQQESANSSRLNHKINILSTLVKQPYFGRFDVKENNESFYIGLAHFMDPETLDLLVYDWRAPVSSLFYEQDYGKKTYITPDGEESLMLILKRHFYSHENGLTHYYDMDATPADTFLIEVLSETSQKHLNPIVQSIQKQQNKIIRSQEVDLLNVQGVPGSGKSIIALHRMAYLLYHSKGSYDHNNMVILSPNDDFKKYIENVLPALGEKMNLQYTMTDLLEKSLGTLAESSDEHLEAVMAKKRKVMIFKNSKNHYLLLKRWLKYYIGHLHTFEDFYFDNQLVLSQAEIKESLLKNIDIKPLGVVLNRYKDKLQSLVDYPMKIKFEALEDQVSKHNLEPEDAILRLKRLKRHFYKKLNRYNMNVLTLDDQKIYRALYEHKSLVMSLGKDLNIPEEFFVRSNQYDDYYSQMCLKLWLNEERSYKHIKYLLVDEAQDYDYIPYQILKTLFYNAKVTLVGDVDQSLLKKENHFFEMTEEVFKPETKENITLETCYRSTENIVLLAKTYMASTMKHVGRKGEPTLVIKTKMSSLKDQLKSCLASHQKKSEEALVVVTSSKEMADILESYLEDTYKVTRHANESLIENDVLILPIYQVKGFEFDRVLYVRNPLNGHIQRHVDYTAVTRAKHEITILDIEV